MRIRPDASEEETRYHRNATRVIRGSLVCLILGAWGLHKVGDISKDPEGLRLQARMQSISTLLRDEVSVDKIAELNTQYREVYRRADNRAFLKFVELGGASTLFASGMIVGGYAWFLRRDNLKNPDDGDDFGFGREDEFIKDPPPITPSNSVILPSNAPRDYSRQDEVDMLESWLSDRQAASRDEPPVQDELPFEA